ncbi:3-mercaptopyruvate sulfurtransferase [Altericroceibacterium xinjiangense]|uniref:3-mercaptopyruvate sulfurtransferase n=1 Tax=Altericroceibacterium xinjiangense TaxID=762261 RepID=UPI000F7E28F4|nr:3-mercaptopyruvate sulfurtransferase [Altericroceibacterium xinjiangense]
MESLVSTDWLAAELGAPDLRILDASSHLPTTDRDARSEFEAAHIPGALFLDLASLTDSQSPVPSALPTSGQFAARMQQLGVRETDRIVVYDDSEVKTSARAWFMFGLFGAGQVAILDGGLGKWRAEGRPLESGSAAFAPAEFRSDGSSNRVRSKQDMLQNIDSGAEQVVDARSLGRFTGKEPDFRGNIPSGHIPHSLNLPFGQLYRQDGTFKHPADMRRAFEAAGVALDRPVVTTCGSGVTAAVLLFALHRLGKDDIALYDGSWSEWAADPTTPKATGAA